MPSTPTFNTVAGQTVERELLLLFLNTGSSSSPVWSVIGKRVEDSSAEYDWNRETKQDILGQTYTTMRKPIITQTFDPCELDSGDAAQVMIWEKAVKEQDPSALCNLDMMVVHCYSGTKDTAMFAERYPSSAVEVTGLGGSNTVGMPITVTFGGQRTTGTAAISNGTATFTAAS